MARIDDYKKALALAKEELKTRNPKHLASESGARFEAEKDGSVRLVIPFLHRNVTLTWPSLEAFVTGPTDPLPLQEHVLLLHYLRGAGQAQEEGVWMAYQDIPDGKFYLDAFLRRAKDPLVQAFGHKPEALLRLSARLYDAQPLDQGDHGVLIRALPKVPVGLILWEGDEEFPPEGNILFDQSIPRILSAEDVAWLSGMVIYPLAGLARKEEAQGLSSKGIDV